MLDQPSSLLLDYQPLQGRVAQGQAYQIMSPPPPLSHWVYSFWQLRTPSGLYHYRSVPDNCVDWIFTIDNPQQNFIITPFLQAREFSVPGPVSYFGIRFRILGYQGLFTIPIGELDDDSNAANLLPAVRLQEIGEAIFLHPVFLDRCQALTKVLLKSLQRPHVDHRLARYIRYCYQHYYCLPPGAGQHTAFQLADQKCTEFGLSARQLRRLCQLHLGLAPKQFARVLRFQAVLSSMEQGPNPARLKLCQIDHYYDQAHFIREFKALAGWTPGEFFKLSVLYNTEPER